MSFAYVACVLQLVAMANSDMGAGVTVVLAKLSVVHTAK